MATKKTETVTIKPMSIQTIKIRIVGDSPLITHAWDEKAKRQMLDTQTGEGKTKKRQTKMPFDDFARSLHWLTPMPTERIIDPATQEERDVVTEELFEKVLAEGARFGFPADSIKIAGNAAAYRLGWVKNQAALRGAYFINADDGGAMLQIKGDAPMMREDMVRVMMSTDIRYRGIFNNWYMDAILEYNASGQMKISDIINVLNAGGYTCGIGEWRPEKDGRFGRFHVEIRK